MTISTFDLFKIGIGPSSSHTVGPMKAAKLFCQSLEEQQFLDTTTQLKVELFGSLGATGKGHGSDKAILLGYLGHTPKSVNVEKIPSFIQDITDNNLLLVNNKKKIEFDISKHIIFHRKKCLDYHPNGLCFSAIDNNHNILLEKTYYSVGGGFVLTQSTDGTVNLQQSEHTLPFPFSTGRQLLNLCNEHGLSISQIMLQNECSLLEEKQVKSKLLAIWSVMVECVNKGCNTEGILPGGLQVKRRAANFKRQLESESQPTAINALDWVDLFALAVNEENAAGGRVVTAPTNGAAGIIPAVLHYYWKFCHGFNDENVCRFLLTAAAIGILYKENASISGAEVGCQGEIGSACSMAAAALTEVLGGTPQQVENAAEIGMEHNLGLTCDPIGGLVQIPCIERNAMGAVKAINASRLALRGDGSHFVSLDKVIKTMQQTGLDMKTKYKETARGGLAVNIIEC